MPKPHSQASVGARHPLHNYEDANAAARDARVYTDADVGKVSKVASPLGYHLLKSHAAGVGTFTEIDGSGRVLQSVYASLASDISTTDTTHPGLEVVSAAITTVAGSYLLVQFSVAGHNSTSNVKVTFRLTVDGVTTNKHTSFSSGGAANNKASAALVHKVTGLSAGAHTIAVDMAVGSGTGLIRPVTDSDSHHASLIVQEIAA